MVKMFSSDKPEIAGDYNLPHIDLINHKGEAIDLKFIFITIYMFLQQVLEPDYHQALIQ